MEFLTRIHQLYDIFFFTASHADYGNAIIDAIAPFVRPCRRYFRDSCLPDCGYMVKDLAILRRPLAQTLLIDDIEGSALANPKNLIRVKPWAGDPNDNVLVANLLPMLEHAAIGADLPEYIRNAIERDQSASIGVFASRPENE
jgi:import inner membrane translocase subunit TIM50